MKTSAKDQVEGTFHELKGRVKEVAGKLSDNPAVMKNRFHISDGEVMK